MADTTTHSPHNLIPDLVGVKSRVSCGAIVAGSAVALATYVVLTLLFAAIGISLSDAGVRDSAVGIGELIAAIFTMVAALFFGGWIASQLTAGENRQEAAIYGILTWAAFVAVMLFLVGVGVRAGYFAAMGGSVVVQNSDRAATWEDAARQQGVPQQQIDQWKATLDPNHVRAEVNDPANRERARQAAMYASWIALVGTMLSMAAAVGGAVAGAGPSFRLFRVAAVRETHGRVVVPGTA
jgi:flavin-binding protein dodecin